jgi:hypothetical protein
MATTMRTEDEGVLNINTTPNGRVRLFVEDGCGDRAVVYLTATEAEALISDLRQRIAPVESTPVHTVRGGKPAAEFGAYGVPHDMDCPGCQGTSFTASPRSEAYWAS